MKQIAWLVLFLTLFGGSSFAQSTVLENVSGTTRWNQVLTPSFQIIFPQGGDSLAMHVANTLERLHQPEAKTLTANLPARIPVLLQDFTTESNGFVSWSPRRVEFFTMPPQRPELAGTNRWEDLLAVHEYRHVVQFTHSRKGFNSLVYYLFGPSTQSGMAFVAVPRWFWEGDAVLAETLYSRSGRGRIPAFSRVFKADLLEGKRFTYNKQHLQSYKDYVPDHYKLGYYMVTHIRRRTQDPAIWSKITAQAFTWSPVPFTFSSAMKKFTGVPLVRNYELMMDELSSIWEEEARLKSFNAFSNINTRKSTVFTDYSLPQLSDDGRVIALKSGIGDIETFVTFDSTGTESKLFIPGIMNQSGMLSIRKNILLWTEFEFDPRWRQKNYSVIKTLDITTGEKHTVAHRTRYGGADLAPDLIKIVTTRTDEQGRNNLVVLDRRNGNLLNVLPNRSNGSYSHARWSEDGKKIYAVKTTDAGKGIVEYDYLQASEKYILEPGNENFSYPVPWKNYLFFNSPYNGTDNIHVLDRHSGRRYMVTQSRYGAYNPAIDTAGQRIIYNEHRINGLDVVSIPLDPASWIPLDSTYREKEFYFGPVLDQEETGPLLDSVPEIRYPVSRYHRFPHLINIHSWGLLASTDFNQLEFGLRSRDILSTLQVSGGYLYDRSEGSGYAYGRLSYQGLYPIIDLGVEKGNRKSDVGSVGDERIILRWNETTFNGRMSVPLLLTRSKWLSELTVSDEAGVTMVDDWQNEFSPEGYTEGPLGERLVVVNSTDSLAVFLNDEVSTGTLVYNSVGLSYYALLKQSMRDLESRYGLYLSGKRISTPFGGDFTGGLWAARASVYLPSPFFLAGLEPFKHHTLQFHGAYQKKDDQFTPEIYSFRNQIPKPRGYSYPDHSKFWFGSVEYGLPLWYPDLGLGPVLYFKRLRANLFMDYGKGTGYLDYYDYGEEKRLVSNISKNYLSAGVELMTDLHVMRFAEQIGVGIRYSRLISDNGNSFDFLLNFNF